MNRADQLFGMINQNKISILNINICYKGHNNRVVHFAISPDGETVVSGSGDNTMRFWKCFPPKTPSHCSK